MPQGTVGKDGLQACRQIVQRPEPIGSALGGCLISWYIISGCLLYQFKTGATPSSQFREALLRPQDSYGNIHRLTDICCIYHSGQPNHHSLILYSYYASHSYKYQQLPMWHILNSYPSHFAIFMDYPPILTLYTNISSPQTLIHSSSPKLKSDHWTQKTSPFFPFI